MVGTMLLWRKIVVQTESQGNRLLASPLLGKYSTTSLGLVGAGGSCQDCLTFETAMAITSKLEGIREIEIHDFQDDDDEGELDSQIFCSPNLKSLSFLRLRWRRGGDEVVMRVTSLPDRTSLYLSNTTLNLYLRRAYWVRLFSLTSLKLVGYHIACPIPISSFFSSTLTHFEIYYGSPPEDEKALLSFLLAVYTQLLVLKLDVDMNPFIPSCTHFQNPTGLTVRCIGTQFATIARSMGCQPEVIGIVARGSLERLMRDVEVVLEVWGLGVGGWGS